MAKKYGIRFGWIFATIAFATAQVGLAQNSYVGLPESCSGYRAGLANGTIIPEVEIARARPKLWSSAGTVSGYLGLGSGVMGYALYALSGSIMPLIPAVALGGGAAYSYYRGYKDLSKVECMQMAIAIKANANHPVVSQSSVYSGDMTGKQTQTQSVGPAYPMGRAQTTVAK
jgi:hypothetical protein